MDGRCPAVAAQTNHAARGRYSARNTGQKTDLVIGEDWLLLAIFIFRSDAMAAFDHRHRLHGKQPTVGGAARGGIEAHAHARVDAPEFTGLDEVAR